LGGNFWKILKSVADFLGILVNVLEGNQNTWSLARR
jgi:hypothetical protein